MGKKTSRTYRVIKWLVRCCYPRMTLQGAENLPDAPAIIVGNHTQMNGPIACELYVPGEHYTWCAGQMMHLKEVPEYAYRDFWSAKPRYLRWFYRLLSYIIAPLSVCVFNNANTIGVYHDARILSTFKETVKQLKSGASVVIFPEGEADYNHILRQFHQKFADVAKLYYKQTGKAVAFVPLYIAPALKKMCFGKPVYYDPEIPMEQQRQQLCEYLQTQITALAQALPRHRVVPFKNVPKKEYPYNIPD